MARGILRLFTRDADGEQALIEGCRRGDARAQQAFFDRLAPRMLAAALRYTGNRPEAEDCLLEGMERALRQLDEYRGEGSLEGWVRRIVVRQALQCVRRRSVVLVDLDQAHDIGDDHWQEAAGSLTTSEIEGYLARLPEGYRLVLQLALVEGYDHDQIAAELGITAATSRSQLTRARARMRQMILADELPTAKAPPHRATLLSLEPPPPAPHAPRPTLCY